QRHRRGELASGYRPAARDEIADGVEALRRRRLRGRDRGREERHQHLDPRTQGKGRVGDFGDPDRQDRAVSAVHGRVTQFDEARGLGEITAEDGTVYPFHCTVIVDGSRTIDEGASVEFEIAAGHRGRWEAAAVTKL